MLARKISASSGASLGRNGRRPAGDLRAEVTIVPLRSPPVRKGIAAGRNRLLLPASGERESRHTRGMSVPNPSSRNLPGGAVLAIFEDHAHGSKLVADAIGLGEVLGLAGSRSRLNEEVDRCIVNYFVFSARVTLQIGATRCCKQS